MPTIRRSVSIVLRLTSLVFLLATALHLCPAPANPVLRCLLAPFAWVFYFMRLVVIFFASFCFIFGDGIAQPRPPAPLKPMPVQTGIQMADLARRHDSKNDQKNGHAHSSDSLLQDAELEEYDDYTDDEDDGSSDDDDEAPTKNHPFKKKS